MANSLKFWIRGDAKSGEKALDSINAKVASATAAFAAWGAATAGAIAAFSIKEAAQFESKMAEVSTLLDDTSGMEGMEQAIKDLAIQYGQFPDDQVESMYSIISAGASSTAEAVQTLEAANRLAIGGVTDVAIAADGLTSALNAYGEEAGTTADISDAMFVAMKAGKTTIGELSGSLGNVAPIAAEAGVGLDELLAATAALTKTGATTSVSMNGLRQVVASVLKPTAEAAKEAKKLGLEFNSAALESKGLQGFLADLEEKTGGNKDSLTQLFGSVEALGPIFALTGSQSEAFSEIMADMEQKTGSTDKALAKVEETGAQAMKRLVVAGDVLAITLGNQLLPAVADLANFLIGPTTEGINRVEDAFMFLKVAAFGALDNMSRSLIALLKPLSEVEKGLNILLGTDVEGVFTGAVTELEMFAAAMEDGAVETIRSRDAVILHNIELKKQSDLLRTASVETEKLSKVESEAADEKVTVSVVANQKLIDAQRGKFLAIEQLTEDHFANDEEREVLRRDRQIAQLTADRQLLVDNGSINAELEQGFLDAKLQAEEVHQSQLLEIQRNAMTQGEQFLELSTRNKVATIIKGGAATLQSVAGSNKAIFQLHKALALADATVSLPSAVVQSYENAGGFPWGIAPAALMGIAGAAQIAQIAGSTFQAHDGIDNFPSSGSFVGNMEKGEMIINKGNSEGIRKLAEDGMNGGGGGVNVTIENINITSSIDLEQDMANIAAAIYNGARNGFTFPFEVKEGVI